MIGYEFWYGGKILSMIRAPEEFDLRAVFAKAQRDAFLLADVDALNYLPVSNVYVRNGHDGCKELLSRGMPT